MDVHAMKKKQNDNYIRKTQLMRVGNEAAKAIKTEAAKYRWTSCKLATQIVMWWIHTGQNQIKTEAQKDTAKNHGADQKRRGR